MKRAWLGIVAIVSLVGLDGCADDSSGASGGSGASSGSSGETTPASSSATSSATSAAGGGGAGGGEQQTGDTCARAIDITTAFTNGETVHFVAHEQPSLDASSCSAQNAPKIYLEADVPESGNYRLHIAGNDPNAPDAALVVRWGCEANHEIGCNSNAVFEETTVGLAKGHVVLVADGDFYASTGLQLTIEKLPACFSDSACSNFFGTNRCDAASGVCVQCLDSNDCFSVECSDDHLCEPCASSLDCASSPVGPACLPSGACGCTIDQDCGVGKACEDSQCFTCQPGLNNCNGVIEDGCESDPLTDGANCGTCSHDCGGAPCSGGVCGAVPIPFGPSVDAFRFVLDGANIYYLDGQSIVATVPSAGGVAVTLVANAGYGTHIATDATRVFYSSNSGVASVLKAGGGGVTYTSSPNAVGAIASDGTNVYWADTDAQQVLAAPVGGGSTSIVGATGGSVKALALAQATIYLLAFQGLQAMPQAGGNANTVANGQGSGSSLWVDTTAAYFTSSGNVLAAYPLAGGSATTVLDLASVGLSGWQALAGDATALYGAASKVNKVTIFKVPKAGGAITALAQSPEVISLVTDIAVDATHVYWAENLLSSHSLYRTAK